MNLLVYLTLLYAYAAQRKGRKHEVDPKVAEAIARTTTSPFVTQPRAGVCDKETLTAEAPGGVFLSRKNNEWCLVGSCGLHACCVWVDGRDRKQKRDGETMPVPRGSPPRWLRQRNQNRQGQHGLGDLSHENVHEQKENTPLIQLQLQITNTTNAYGLANSRAGTVDTV